ncbi:MAG: hypothetical protein NTV44_06580, partial [Firmicutes bacterium]|nr:hypothetical protein [Bacillota bacterium]
LFMVKVVFLNLLRSKYNIEQLDVHAGTIQSILDEIKKIHPELDTKDFSESLVFINQVRLAHGNRFLHTVKDGDEVVFTHFLGGG